MTIPSDNTPVKRCSQCKQEFPVTTEFFQSNKGKRDSLTARCKSCISTARKLAYQRKPKIVDSEIPEGHKRCNSCKKVLPATTQYFPIGSRYAGKLRPQCIPCKRGGKHVPRPTIPDGCKMCVDCKEVKPASKDHFYANKNSRSKLSSSCKICTQARMKSEKALRQEGVPIGHRKCIVCMEVKPLDLDNFYISGGSKGKFAHTCKACASIRGKVYYQTHPEVARGCAQNRRARKQNAPGSYTHHDILDQLKRQKHRCYYCSKRFEKRKGKYIYHIEHTFPLSRQGGRNDKDSIVLACPPCNLSKHNRFPWEWPQGGRLL